MKVNPICVYRLSARKKVFLIGAIFLLELAFLGLILIGLLKGYYLIVGVLLFWALMNIVTALQCCTSSISIFTNHCVVKTWLHPKGVKIEWKKIEEIYFRHYTLFNDQRIVIRYNDNKQKPRQIVVLCDESDYIEDMIQYLDSKTKIRKY